MNNNDLDKQRRQDSNRNGSGHTNKHGFFYWVGIVLLTLLVGVFVLAGLVFGACFFGF